ncbi:DUF2141 domain-containing protein [Nafulsella turpanensis]|uniref:DUF2141 domain-containing protein n=1 Tax=Nafulsella turpanensis TaxID=1265690 RepID=UPI0003485A93|nr:DUF2141 domain-containing protein [Nafulsella turpanensis]
MKTFFILSCSLIFLNFIIPKEERGTLKVTVTGIDSAEGLIRAALFQGEEGFPDDEAKSFRTASVEAKEDKVIFFFEDLPYGDYAISLLHDENENGKMDTNIFSYPKEAYGISNNPEVVLSVPSYQEAMVELQEPQKNILIHLRN